MPKQNQLDAIRTDFIEKSGLISQAEGLPRIAGRVFGMLIFDGELVSFGDLANRLQVSRASISTSIRLLEERGLVKRKTKPGQRGDFFQLAQNPYATMLEGVHKRTLSTLDDIKQTIAALPADAEATARLTAYADFYASLESAVTVARDELQSKKSNTAQSPTIPKD
ncbi:DNA-binding transcriptional regulator GbsR, MarR family [Cognatiyoonia koreensis]|uniref:DNA-binding transcriptional regulator GbsR, MarR family n=1 Tax=Cognatiyoonia koreensis TaxID=364200 RepID=A0A1I0MY38_9RHOB|nr:MarR family transcriptional regulator [Cognatiyoonia koreensis]SEV93237.1 DNA-binding transcriptional regulator GbsR, MarR family [Cognatiyoonia koreensis]